MWYVNIDGISDSDLAFLGYDLVAENNIFKVYIDSRGNEYVVQKSKPRLMVHDVNDASILASKSSHQPPIIIGAPPSVRS